MIKHIYVNSSLENRHELYDSKRFIQISDYDPLSRSKMLQNEIGMINIGNTIIHFLGGKIFSKNCPWCEGPPEIMEGSPFPVNFKNLWIQCKECGARGPKITISIPLLESKEYRNVLVDLLWQKWSDRKAWFEDFQNPYESVTDSNQLKDK